MKTKFITIYLICLAFLMLESCGTIIGFSIGAARENNYNREKPVEISGNEIINLDGEDSITVNLKKGQPVHGRFMGKLSLNAYHYKEDYQQFISTNSLDNYLPLLDDTLHIVTTGKRQLKKIFAGFCSQGLLIKDKHEESPETLYYISISTISSQHGESVSGRTLLGLIKKNELPLNKVIAIDPGGTPKLIQPYQIASIELPARGKNELLKCTLIGLGIDAAIVAIGLMNMKIDVKMDSK